ncbi:serine/threonine-protein kinase [Ramlibacter tataouinensis]|uniref:serine/threonine-protein kinase n=1 Tax=Ramlibacter tataouinensis TaxID=94132 RepID=UPI0022F3A683|nr:serine/threonine-protein kinase [Ramlibacter tataouinensis]WBY02464.1 serine/threonine-protein kinase [Ramlibacter tataouinensis]
MTALEVQAAVFAGPWELQAVLGRGRRSTVYRALDAQGRTAAVKVCAGADLAREHRLLATFRHPHLLRPLGCGRGPQGPWLASEWAQGGALPAPPAGGFADAQVRRWLAELGGALAHLHRRGWVHRDLKPANLLRRADGSLVLADLGEAVPAGTPGPAPGTVVGSPRYAAPEQSQGAPAAPAADVYSLGVLLHEWLTGWPAYGGETPAELQAQHLIAPVPRLCAERAHWQPLLDALMAKDPAHRLPDGQAVLTRNAT